MTDLMLYCLVALALFAFIGLISNWQTRVVLNSSTEPTAEKRAVFGHVSFMVMVVLGVPALCLLGIMALKGPSGRGLLGGVNFYLLFLIWAGVASGIIAVLAGLGAIAGLTFAGPDATISGRIWSATICSASAVCLSFLGLCAWFG